MDDTNGDNGQPDTAGNRERSDPETGRAPQVVGPKQPEPVIVDTTGRIIKDKKEQPYIETTEARPSIESSQQDILDRIKTGERWMIFFTAIVALTTVAQVVQSGCNNSATSKQTDKIIAAANVNASAAMKNAAAADRFAASADGINTKIDAVEQDFQHLATNSREGVNATLAQSRLEQRAWLGLYSPTPNTSQGGYGLQFNSFVLLRNTGRTPAINVNGIVITMNRSLGEEIPDFDVEYAILAKKTPSIQEKRTPTILDSTGIISYFSGTGEAMRRMLPENSVIAPDAAIQVSLAAESHKDEPLNQGTQVLYMIGKVTYDDDFTPRGRHTTKFCYGYSHAALYVCPTGNSMN